MEQATITKKSLNEKNLELETKVERLNFEVSKANDLSITGFKESNAYKSDLVDTTSFFLIKEIIKMQRLLQRLYQIEDVSFSDKIVEELMSSEDKKAEERGKKVTQKDPQRC